MKLCAAGNSIITLAITQMHNEATGAAKSSTVVVVAFDGDEKLLLDIPLDVSDKVSDI